MHLEVGIAVDRGPRRLVAEALAAAVPRGCAERDQVHAGKRIYEPEAVADERADERARRTVEVQHAQPEGPLSRCLPPARLEGREAGDHERGAEEESRLAEQLRERRDHEDRRHEVDQPGQHARPQRSGTGRFICHSRRQAIDMLSARDDPTTSDPFQRLADSCPATREASGVKRHDVLVVGAGIAGLRAALAAHARGVDVAIVSKLHPVRSASHAANVGILAGSDPEITLRQLLEAGQGLAVRASSERLARGLAAAVRDVEGAGGIAHGPLVGQRALQGLYGLVVRAAIPVYEELQLVELCVEGGRCSGAIAWDVVAGRMVGVTAQATVIASGGLGRIYGSTPRAATGDGTAIAWRAGAALRDMEFVQFAAGVARSHLGGIDVDADGRSTIVGLYAAGEAACSGAHGAAGLEGALLAEALVLGSAAGAAAASTVVELPGDELVPEARVAAAEERVLGLLGRGDGERPSALRAELHELMVEGAGPQRSEAGLELALERIQTLRVRAERLRIDDRSRRFNTALVGALELESLLALAECIATGALARVESRGVHRRSDHPERDDARFQRHALIWCDAGQVRLDLSAGSLQAVSAR